MVGAMFSIASDGNNAYKNLLHSGYLLLFRTLIIQLDQSQTRPQRFSSLTHLRGWYVDITAA